MSQSRFVLAIYPNPVKDTEDKNRWLPAEIQVDPETGNEHVRCFGWHTFMPLLIAKQGGIVIGPDLITVPNDDCCAPWQDAKLAGTDGEGFSPLIRDFDGQWKIGMNLPGVSFCPWCGAKKFPR